MGREREFRVERDLAMEDEEEEEDHRSPSNFIAFSLCPLFLANGYAGRRRTRDSVSEF